MYLLCGEVRKLAGMSGEEIVSLMKQKIISDEDLREMYCRDNSFCESEINAWKNESFR